MANKRIKDFSTVLSAPRVGDVIEVDNATEGSAQIPVEALLPQSPPNPQTPSGNFLRSGGAYAHTENLDIAVGESVYSIQGVDYLSPATILTLTTADATHPRFDAIVLNTSNVAVVVTGTPAASPAHPVIDPSTQLALTFIRVDALATEPEVNTDPIYLENTEWATTVSNARIIANDNTGERTGAVAIKFNAALAGDNIKFVDAAPFVLDDFELLTFWVNPVTFVSQKQIQLQCRNANAIVGTTVSLRNGRYGLDTANPVYQLVAVPISDFGLNGAEIDEIRQTVAGGGTALTCFIDDIALQGGPSSAVTRGMINPMTTAGDSIVGGASGAPTRLALGTSLQVRRVNSAGTAEEFASPKADELQAGTYAADAGANDTYVATLSPAITAYTTGVHYRFKANTSNTGAATINFNGLGAKTIKKAAGGITTDLADNDIRAGQWVDLVYDGTNMQMQSLLGNAASGSGDMLLGTAQIVTAAKTFNAGTLKAASAGDLVDSNGNELLKFPSAVGSATNEITISNAPNGSAPTIAASGSSDSNVNLMLEGKGALSAAVNGATNPGLRFYVSGTAKASILMSTGSDGGGIIGSATNDLCFRLENAVRFRFSTDAGASSALIIAPLASQVNGVTITPSITATAPTITPHGSDTNINLNLGGKGTGAVRIDGTNPTLQYAISGTLEASIGIAVGSGSIIAGSALGDHCSRISSNKFLWSGDDGTTAHMTMNAGALAITGAITTGNPSGGTAAAFKVGVAASVSPTSPNRTIEIDVNGTRYFLHAKTTND